MPLSSRWGHVLVSICLAPGAIRTSLAPALLQLFPQLHAELVTRVIIVPALLPKVRRPVRAPWRRSADLVFFWPIWYSQIQSKKSCLKKKCRCLPSTGKSSNSSSSSSAADVLLSAALSGFESAPLEGAVLVATGSLGGGPAMSIVFFLIIRSLLALSLVGCRDGSKVYRFRQLASNVASGHTVHGMVGRRKLTRLTCLDTPAGQLDDAGPIAPAADAPPRPPPSTIAAVRYNGDLRPTLHIFQEYEHSCPSMQHRKGLVR